MPIFLVLVAGVCFAIQDWITGVVVLSLTGLHSLLTVMEELQSDRAAEALKAFLLTNALVKRSGKWKVVVSNEVVPGDLIKIKMGDVVPADCTLQEGEALELDQSVVTGESLPVVRDVHELAYCGSLVLSGAMSAVVIRPNQSSVFGRSAQLATGPKAQTRLQTLLVNVATVISVLAFVLAFVLVVVKFFITKSSPIFILQTALGMLVAAIPISMVIVVASAFVLAARELRSKGIMVSRFNAIEQLAGIDIVLMDKTGTITQNRLQLGEPWLHGDTTTKELIEMAALASSTEHPDVIERVICAAVDLALMQRFSVIRHESFTASKKYSMASIRRVREGSDFEVLKGAPQALLVKCGFDDAFSAQVLAQVDTLARRGLRSLAIVMRDHDSMHWRFLGILTLRDPPRPDAPEFVAGMKRLGVSVQMVTGDGVDIARETCKMVGVGDGSCVVNRKSLLNMVANRSPLHEVHAFAEVFPEDKFNVVELLRQKDHSVAMTGDGINDCPALRHADVGIAVHGATPASVLASDMILTTPRLMTIRDAVLECRVTVERLRNYLLFRINCTMVILFWSFFGSLAMTFAFPALVYVCIAWSNNLAIFSLICDNALVPLRPAKWKGLDIIPYAIFYCITSFLEMYLVFALASGGYLMFSPSPAVGEIRSIMFLALILFLQWSVLVIRCRSIILAPESARPGWLLLVFLSLNSFAATMLAAFWPFGGGLDPIGWNDIAQVWVIAAVSLLFKDIVKVLFTMVLSVATSPPPDEDEYPGSIPPTKSLEWVQFGSQKSRLTLLDKIYDLLFVVIMAQLGALLLAPGNATAWVDFAAHWFPLYYSWYLLEGFVNRFSHLKWIPMVYFGAAFSLVGAGVNVSSCSILDATSINRLYACSAFALFIFMGRLILACAWLFAALSYKGGRGYLTWKIVSTFVPGTVYWSAIFLASINWVLLPTFWFIGIGLDILLNFIPTSFFWDSRNWMRHPRYSEERHGMLQVGAMAEIVLSVLFPRIQSSNTIFSDMTLLLVLVFIFAMWSFVVGESSKVERNGGHHALSGKWPARIIWLMSQFWIITGLIVISLVCKTITHMSPFDRVSLGVWTSIVIWAGLMGQLVITPSPTDRRISSRWFRHLIRFCCGAVALGLAFIPVTLMTDVNWLVLVISIIGAGCLIEHIARIKDKNLI